MTRSIEDKILDRLDQALIQARESTNPSLSSVILQMTNKLDQHIQTHEEDVKDIKNDIALLKQSVQPAVKAVDTANGLRTGVIWMAGLIIASGSIWVAIVQVKNWIKH